MPRTLTEIVATLPPDRQVRIEAQYQSLKKEIETSVAPSRIVDRPKHDVTANSR